MTDAKYDKLVERVAEVIHTGPTWTHEAPLANTICKDQARAALDAANYRELREAAEGSLVGLMALQSVIETAQAKSKPPSHAYSSDLMFRMAMEYRQKNIDALRAALTQEQDT